MKLWDKFLNSIEIIINKTLSNRLFYLESLMKNIDEKLENEYKQCNDYANENPIKIITPNSQKILDDNCNRKNLIIQNIGLYPCYIKLCDEEVTLKDFHIVLASDTSENQGNGGSIELKNWHGSIYAISERDTKLSVLEY